MLLASLPLVMLFIGHQAGTGGTGRGIVNEGRWVAQKSGFRACCRLDRLRGRRGEQHGIDRWGKFSADNHHAAALPAVDDRRVQPAQPARFRLHGAQ